MTIEVLHERGMSNRAIARQLGVDEKAIRYRLWRQSTGARDRRSEKPFLAEPWAEAIAHWMRERDAIQYFVRPIGFGFGFAIASARTLNLNKRGIVTPASTHLPYFEINTPTCPGCSQSIQTPDATFDCYIDGREPAWLWSCLNQVASEHRRNKLDSREVREVAFCQLRPPRPAISS